MSFVEYLKKNPSLQKTAAAAIGLSAIAGLWVSTLTNSNNDRLNELLNYEKDDTIDDKLIGLPTSVRNAAKVNESNLEVDGLRVKYSHLGFTDSEPHENFERSTYDDSTIYALTFEWSVPIPENIRSKLESSPMYKDTNFSPSSIVYDVRIDIDSPYLNRDAVLARFARADDLFDDGDRSIKDPSTSNKPITTAKFDEAYDEFSAVVKAALAKQQAASR